MKGFRDFLMQGNVLDLAIAVIIGAAFGDVVKAFTKILMDIIGLFGGKPDFSQVTIGPINVGVFLTALVSFVIIAAVIYFGIIKPVMIIKARFVKPAGVEEIVADPTAEQLLAEIRDLLAARKDG